MRIMPLQDCDRSGLANVNHIRLVVIEYRLYWSYIVAKLPLHSLVTVAKLNVRAVNLLSEAPGFYYRSGFGQ